MKDNEILCHMYIVYACDDNFAEILGVSLMSLLESNKNRNKITVYILNSGISPKNREKINSVFKKYNRFGPVWIDAKNINEVAGIKVKQDRGSISQFARLFVSSVLPDNLEKVLYLDCDIIINKSLCELWNMDLRGKTIAALLDPFSTWYRKNLKLRDEDFLFNSGVMLIDLNKWREQNIEKKIIDLIKKFNGLIPQGDQGTLNVILNRDITLIKPKFNAVTVFYDFSYEDMLIYRKPPFYYEKEEIEEATENPHIIHFTTSFLSKRPWVPGSNHPYAKKWLKYKARSPWKDEPLRYYKSTLIKNCYLRIYKAIPLKIAVGFSGILQAYGRPIVEKIKYRIL